jgi:DNA-binding CsgD family transcriptional regulator
MNLGNGNLRILQNTILEHIFKIFKAESAVFFFRYSDDNNLDTEKTVLVNLSWQYIKQYIKYYYHIDPFFQVTSELGAFRDTDLMPHSALRKLEYFNDFIKPQRINHLLVIYLMMNNKILGHIGINRHGNTPEFSIKDLFKGRLLSKILSLKLTHDQLKCFLIESPVPSNNWKLTVKEIEVVQYIRQGLTNKEISEKLYMSLPTVATHVSHIFTKLDVNNRVKLVNKLPVKQ